MTRTTWIGGAMLASVAAGPIVVAMLLLLTIAASWLQPLWPRIGFLVAALMFGLPFGFVISLIPNVTATAVLAWAGDRWRAARHPLVWAGCGLMLGGLIAAGWSGGGTIAGNLSLGIVGLFCALICRRGTHWPD